MLDPVSVNVTGVAPSFTDQATVRPAVLSAVRDVRKANVGADVRRVDGTPPDDYAVVNAFLEWQYQMQRHPTLADETRQSLSPADVSI